jgi:threonylcarbamoyladenosine tRNA methylthiotransferase MtaB
LKKAALHNLGCKVNAYETDAMMQMLEADGYEIVPFLEKADLYIINTCTVTNIADRKSRQMLHKAKKMNPDAVIVATGCYVQAAEKELIKDESVDIVIGNNRKQDLVEIIHEYEKQKIKQEEVIDMTHLTVYEELTINKVAEHTRAYIKVQDGCNQFCSYCIIPYTRGRVRSRKKEEVAKEVRRLALNGYKEVVLTGIHLSSYGVDLKEEENLLSLIQAIHEVEGIERIRMGSLEPGIITEEFVKEISRLPKICPHFHLSLQSGCDATLARMNRKYTCDEYYERCRILRKYFGHPGITTDIIVGFPGETEEEFQTTKEFLEKVSFYEMHVFKYSKRKGTKAARMTDQVADREKGKRSSILLELNRIMSAQYRDALIGKEVSVLIEEEVQIDDKRWQIGHTKEYVKVGVYAGENLENQIIRGRITGKLTEEILLCKITD